MSEDFSRVSSPDAASAAAAAVALSVDHGDALIGGTRRDLLELAAVLRSEILAGGGVLPMAFAWRVGAAHHYRGEYPDRARLLPGRGRGHRCRSGRPCAVPGRARVGVVGPGQRRRGPPDRRAGDGRGAGLRRRRRPRCGLGGQRAGPGARRRPHREPAGLREGAGSRRAGRRRDHRRPGAQQPRLAPRGGRPLPAGARGARPRGRGQRGPHGRPGQRDGERQPRGGAARAGQARGGGRRDLDRDRPVPTGRGRAPARLRAAARGRRPPGARQR